MSPTEAIPLLIVVLLLVSVGGGEVEQLSVTFEGDHEATALDDALVVAGGTTTVPASASVAGDLYVTGGTVRIDGTVDGDVTVLAGRLSVADGATVTGTVQTISGETAVADGATVGAVSAFEPPAPATSPAQRVTTLLLEVLVVGAAGWWLGRRRPALLENVGHAITDHTVVSGVVGALAASTLLVLFVYMAFTLLLLPVSVLGLLAELVVVLYAQVAYGHLIGRRLPVENAGLATFAGVTAFLIATELLGEIPYLGTGLQLLLLVVGFGAVLNTYFGLARFEPVHIPGGADR